MKTRTLILILILISIGLNAQTPTEPETFKITLPVITAILAGLYEVLSRIVPTSKTWSIIGKALEVLTFLSNLFDRRKKK